MPIKKIYPLLFIFFTTYTIYAQISTGPQIAWQRCYGTSGYDFFTDAITTSDGGFAAFVLYDLLDGDFADTLAMNSRLLKFDSEMNLIWQRSYENLLFEQILEVSDGYILAGATIADTGIASGNHGNRDILLVKTDLNGNFLWSRCYGSSGDDGLSYITLTSDGYILLNIYSYSQGGDILDHFGSGFTTDAVIVKTDLLGNVIWSKNYGGSEYDFIEGPIIEINAKYYFTAVSFSNDHDLEESDIMGGKVWLFKTDTNGNILDEKFYMQYDPIVGVYNSIEIDGNIFLAGLGGTLSSTFPPPVGHEESEALFAKYDTSLIFTDYGLYGGSKSDNISDFAFLTNGIFYVAGYSRSGDYDLPGNYNNSGESDYWLFAIDTAFNLLWSKNFGGSSPQGEYTFTAGSVGSILYKNNFLYYFGQCQVPDVLPDYDIACGHINPDLDDDTDAWLVAFDLSTVNIDMPIVDNNFSIYPNPAENSIFISGNTPDSNAYTFLMYNTLGQKVYEVALINNEENKINIQSLPSGLYVAAIKSDGIIIQSEKIILQ
ncbi:MAG TPA: T9SS type A sorting domain-containing protein [Chitinophagales bacterium]|nr:T9SS type A sorting domain-containing protein [Chitinophagales bacterium]